MLTVIVPTRDRPAALVRCLAALDLQDTTTPFEIVVVDDGSRDEQAVAAVAARHDRVRLVRTPGLGLGAARNVGVRAATGEVVLFTDDDCRPDAGWARLLEAALAGGADASGGCTVPGDGSNPYARVSEAVCDFARERIGFLIGNNIACRREVVAAIPFDETSPVPAAEDREWSARLVRAGHRIAFAPEALVRHEPALSGLPSFWAQHVRYGRGAAWLARRPVPGTAQAPRFYLALLGAGFRRSPRDGLLVCVAQLATATGYLLERRR